MRRVEILKVSISNAGNLLVSPQGTEEERKSLFPHIYRMATGTFWNEAEASFSSPVPKQWSYADWLRDIAHCARSELGFDLYLSERTLWENVAETDRVKMLEALSMPDA